MAWTTPLTAVSNAALTAAQWNASVRDDLLTTPAALATGANQWFVSSGANTVVARTPSFGNTVSTSQGTTSTSFVDLATVGPSLTTTIGAQAISLWGCQLANSGAGSAYMSYTGANVTANTSFAVQCSGTAPIQASYTHFVTCATPGSTTFTCNYAASSGTATFQDRRFQLLPF
jgi:hypothetical protein